VNCAVCQSQTQPVRIDGQDYCSICGNRYGGKPATPVLKSAAQLHHRSGGRHVIDLRAQTPSQAPVRSSASAPAVQTPATTARTQNQKTAPPSAAAHERHIASFTDRFERARQFSRSTQISRFGADRMGNVKDPHQMSHHTGDFATAAPAPAHHGHEHQPAMPNHAVTQHQAMTQLSHLPPAPTPPPSAPPKAGWRPHLSLSPHTGRLATTAAAIVILGGYIWLHNYPKLAVQNAGSQAGLTAALPSFLPSSYSLAGTSTGPGLLKLKFTSPSAEVPLTIAQQRTTWDPSSLLDNYVAKNTDDYAAVQGQGLTIYLFGNNNATWVNHGIWYSIAGADRLSRDQILKIAYSL
jgi:hypothetical protein